MSYRILPLTFLLACATAPADGFMANLRALCGQAFEGRMTEGSPQDSAFRTSRLVMHVRECNDSVIRIPFHLSEDRSRTWVITRTADGIRLKHDHRHQDGTEDSVTQYGGDTQEEGTATLQQFPADGFTAGLIPAARTNIWTVEVIPGTMFAYALRREGTDRRIRVEFDLTRAVEAPPPPW